MSEDLEGFKNWLNSKSKRKTRAKLQDTTKKQYILQLENEDLSLDVDALQKKIYSKSSLLFNAAIKNYLLYKQESGVIDRKTYLGIIKELDFKMTSSMHDSKLTFEELKNEVFTNEERDKLLAYSENKQYALTIHVLYDSAARKSEIVHPQTGIKVGEIRYSPDEKDRQISSVDIQGKGYAVKSRTVNFEPDTTEMIVGYIAANNLQPSDNLITLVRRDGKPYINQGSRLWRVLYKIGKEVIGRPIKPHSFRHTKLTDMVNSGARIEDVQAYAGHSDIGTTRIYAKLSAIQSKRGFDASRRIL